MANKYFYTLDIRESSRPYLKAEIEIYPVLVNQPVRYDDRLATFTWQGEQNDPKRFGWYAFSANVNQSRLSEFSLATSQVKRVLKATEDSTCPTTILTALASFRNYEYRVKDDRTGDYTPVNEVADEGWNRWTNESGYANVLAYDEDDAKKEMFKKFAELSLERPWSGVKNQFEKWITNGKQVQINNYRNGQRPNTDDPLRLVRWEWEQCQTCSRDIEPDRINRWDKDNIPTTCLRCEPEVAEEPALITEDFFANVS